MKKYLLIAAILIASVGSALSQDKVLEKSGKQPKWINGLEKDYIIVVGTGGSSQDAQQNALSMVKEQIVLAVAQNVKAKTEMRTEEANYNNNVSVFLEKFASSTTSESGKVPFLQGISLSKVEEFYWEKLQKKDKSVYFQYHIKYPFPEFELKKLVSDFKMRDAELTRQLEELLAQVETVESVEQIEKNMGELKVLTDYFMDGRKDQANLGITRYRSLLSSIELVEMENTPGFLKYYLRLGTKKISTVKKPVIKSECAKAINSVNEQEYWVVKYDYSNCYEGDENNLLVKYRFGNTDVQKPFYFDLTTNKAKIHISDPIHFSAISKGESTVEGAIIDLTVVSSYEAQFTIDKVVLEFKGMAPIIIEGIDQSFKGKGNHSLKLNTSQSIKIEGSSSLGKAIALISGKIYYRSVTGEQRTYTILNHSYTTDW